MKIIKTLQENFINDLYEKKLLGKYISPHNLSNTQLIQIYQNNFFSTHIDSLKASYKKTVEVLGEEAFEQTARDYIKSYLPEKESIQNYGHQFSHFLKNYKNTQKFLYLPDLAYLEFLLNKSYYSKNTPHLDLNQFAKAQAKDPLLSRIRLHTSCHLISSAYPLDKILQLTKQDLLEIKENQKFYFLVIRNNFFSKVLVLKIESFAFLSEIHKNQDILCSTKKAIEVNKNFNLQNELLFFLNQKAFMLKTEL